MSANRFKHILSKFGSGMDKIIQEAIELKEKQEDNEILIREYEQKQNQIDTFIKELEQEQMNRIYTTDILTAKVKETGKIIHVGVIMERGYYYYVQMGIKDPYKYRHDDLEFIREK